MRWQTIEDGWSIYHRLMAEIKRKGVIPMAAKKKAKKVKAKAKKRRR